MAAISTWSTTAASNNSASPDGWPENMAPSGVNNSARENMAQVRSFYENIEWRDWGHTITQASGTTFTTGASNDTTGIYLAGRRVKAVGSSTGTIYGLISSSTGTNPTTVTVVWDSGSLVSESLTVSVGASPTGDFVDAGSVSRSAQSVTTTRGDLVYRGASDMTPLAVGTSSQVVGSDGTDPTYVTNGGYLKSTAITALSGGESEIAINVSANTDYMVRIWQLEPSNDGVEYGVHTFEGSYITSGYTSSSDNGASRTPSTTQVLFASNVGSAAGEAMHFCEFEVIEAANASVVTSVIGQGLATNSAGTVNPHTFCGVRDTAAAATKFRIIPSAGTFDAGSYQVFTRSTA